MLRFGPQFAFVDDESYRTTEGSLSSDDEEEDWGDESGFDGNELAMEASLKTFETFDPSLAAKSTRTVGTLSLIHI